MGLHDPVLDFVALQMQEGVLMSLTQPMHGLLGLPWQSHMQPEWQQSTSVTTQPLHPRR